MGLEGASGVELSLVGDEIQAEVLMGKSRSVTVNHTQPSTLTETDGEPSKRRGRIPGSKNKPKGDTNVATDSETGNDLDSSGTSDTSEETNSDQTTDEEDIFAGSFDNDEDEDDGTGSEESSAGSASRGNLFGDSDSESSETIDPEDKTDSDTKAEAAPVNRSGKRTSIFDAD
jgi:hypothetical protein